MPYSRPRLNKYATNDAQINKHDDCGDYSYYTANAVSIRRQLPVALEQYTIDVLIAPVSRHLDRIKILAVVAAR